MKYKRFILLRLWLLVPGLLPAHMSLSYVADSLPQSCPASCCFEDKAPAGIMINHLHSRGQWMLSYRLMYMQMGAMQSGSSLISQNTVFNNYLMSSENMQMQMHMLMAMYGITNRITLMGMFHYHLNSMQMLMMPGSTHVHNGGNGSNHKDMHMNTSGLGDTRIHALIGLLNSTRHELIFAIGAGIPTGSISQTGDRESMYYNTRFPYVMQLGTGTWDVLPSLTWAWDKRQFAFSAQAGGTIRTGYNNIGYKYGNEGFANLWGAYKWHGWFSSSLRLEAMLMAPMEGSDKMLYIFDEPAANNDNYGHERVSAYAGTSFHIPWHILSDCKISAEYGLPVYQNLNGIQMRNTGNLNLALSVMF